MKALIAVVGDAGADSRGPRCRIAEEVGRRLIDSGYRLLTGGLGGVMEAASRGARSSNRWCPGDIIGVLPGCDPCAANEFVDVPICTGLDHGRNLLIGQAAALVVVGGGAGTLSEMAFGWMHRRLLVGIRCGGWGERLADQRIDERIRYPQIPGDRVYGAADASEAIALIDLHLPSYDRPHRGVPARFGPKAAG